MIKVITKEYVDGDLAVMTVEVSFLHIVIYRYKKTLTSAKAIAQLNGVIKGKPVIGF